MIIFVDKKTFLDYHLFYHAYCSYFDIIEIKLSGKSNRNITKKNIIEEILSKIVSDSGSWNDTAPQKTRKVIGVDFIPRLQVCQAMSC